MTNATMTNILTSKRARAVLDKIGWPEWVWHSEQRLGWLPENKMFGVYEREHVRWISPHEGACIIAEHLRAWLHNRNTGIMPDRGRFHVLGAIALGNFATDHEALLAAVEAEKENEHDTRST